MNKVKFIEKLLKKMINSLYRVDSNKKVDNSVNGKVFTENKKIEKVLYHISPVKNRESILNEGLIVKAGERSIRLGQTEKRIYVCDRLWKIHKLISCSFWNTHPDFKEGFDLYRIVCNAKLYKDEKFEYGLYIKENVKKIEYIITIKNERN